MALAIIAAAPSADMLNNAENRRLCPLKNPAGPDRSVDG
jgi:hypothetical protein